MSEQENIVVDMLLKYTQFNAGLKQVNKGMENFVKKVTSVTGAIMNSQAAHNGFSSKIEKIKHLQKANIPIVDKLGISTNKLTNGIHSISGAISNSMKKYKGFNSLSQQIGLNTKANIPVIDKLGVSLMGNENQISTLGKTYDSFGKAMTMPMEHWKKFNKEGGVFNSRGAKFANTTRKMMHGMRGFKMEMLGVMFFGMAMANAMKQLLKPAAQATGIFEVFGATLQVVFLPIMLALLPMLLEVAQYFMGLSDNAKMVIGVIALLALAFGTVLMVLGQLFLGISSLILFAPELIAIFSGIASVIGAMFSPIGLILLAFIVGFVSAWKENFGRIKEWTSVLWKSIGKIFGGIIDVVKGIFKILWGLFNGDTKTMVEGFKNIWNGLKKFFTGLWGAITAAIVIVAITITKMIYNIVKVVWNTIISFIEGTVNFAIDVLNDLITLANKVKGVDITHIGKVDFSGAKLGELGSSASDYKTYNEVQQEITININGGDPEQTRTIVQEELQEVVFSM